MTAYHREKYYAHGPNIGLRADVFVTVDHLGGCVARAAAGGLEETVAFVGVGEAEVDDFYDPAFF